MKNLKFQLVQHSEIYQSEKLFDIQNNDLDVLVPVYAAQYEQIPELQ